MSALCLLTMTGLAGCAGGHSREAESSAPEAPTSAAPAASRLPPRPEALRLAGVDPCALLSPAQTTALSVEAGVPGSNHDELGSADCSWASTRGSSGTDLLARAIVKRGADYALDSVTGTQVVQVGGFSAVQTSSDFQNPQFHCILVVDVAQGQSLWVQAANVLENQPGMNHQVACQIADKAAESMVANLRNLVH